MALAINPGIANGRVTVNAVRNEAFLPADGRLSLAGR